MANEITLRRDVEVNNGSYKNRFNPGPLQLTQNAQGANSGIVSVGITEETITFTDITTEGLFVIQNIDLSNFIVLGPDSGGLVDFFKIKPGEHFVVRLHPGATVKPLRTPLHVSCTTCCWKINAGHTVAHAGFCSIPNACSERYWSVKQSSYLSQAVAS